MHFYRPHKLHQDPVLTLNGSAIPVIEETKFLGIIFDRKLSFLPHIRHLKDTCTKALNLLRVVAHTTWGASANIDSSIQIAHQIETMAVWFMALLEVFTYASWIRFKIMHFVFVLVPIERRRLLVYLY